MLMMSKVLSMFSSPFPILLLFFSCSSFLVVLYYFPGRVITTIYLIFIACWIIIHEGVIISDFCLRKNF